MVRLIVFFLILIPCLSHSKTLFVGALTQHWIYNHNFSPYINQLSSNGQLIYNPMIEYETDKGVLVFGGLNSIGYPMLGTGYNYQNWVVGFYLQDSEPWDKIIIKRGGKEYAVLHAWPKFGQYDVAFVGGYSLKFKWRLSQRTYLVQQTLIGPVTVGSLGIEW